MPSDLGLLDSGYDILAKLPPAVTTIATNNDSLHYTRSTFEMKPDPYHLHHHQLSSLPSSTFVSTARMTDHYYPLYSHHHYYHHSSPSLSPSSSSPAAVAAVMPPANHYAVQEHS